MADNFETNAASGGLTFASDDIAGVQYPIHKLGYGALDGVTLVSTSNGLPVQGTFWQTTQPVSGPLTDTQLRASAVPVDASGTPVPVTDNGGSLTVDGTVAVSGTVTVDGSGSTQPVSGPLTDTELRASAVAVDASGATVPVSGTFWQATQPVSGPLTDTQLRATAVPVSGAFWQTTQPVSLASVPSHAVTNAGTFAVQADTELTTADLDTGAGTDTRAVVGIALAASGGAVLAGTANPIPVSDNGGSLTVDGTFWQATQPVSIAGTVTVNASGNPVPVTDNSGSLTVDQPTGTNLHTVVDSGTITTVSAVTAITNALPAGTNAIGKLAANSGVTIGDVNLVSAVPAGTNLLGKIAASDETSTVYNGTTALTPKFAKIAASSSGDNTLVAAVTSKKIRVLAYNFMANGTVNAKFQSGAAGTDLTGLKYLVVNTGLVAPYNPLGWFESASGVLLNLNLSAGIAVGGELVYVEV